MRRSDVRRACCGMAFMMSSLLAACGGGGGGSEPAPPLAAARPLVLASGGDREVTVGASFVNQATSPNARAVNYTSSDPRVATVTGDGRVEALARGTATITAAEAGGGTQPVTYVVRVLPAVLNGIFLDGTSLRSAYTGIDYPYTVYLPASYATGNKRYPVMVMTDGQWASNLYQIADRKGKEVILVMILQGPDDRRMVDYTPPGAAAYIDFLKKEMVPRIESTYRTNGDRTYYGVSAGGTLGAVLLADEPLGAPYFDRYILGDPAFQLLTPDILTRENARFNASPDLPVGIFMTGSPQANLPLAQAFAARYRKRQYRGMDLQLSEYRLPHVEMAEPTFTEAIDRYF